MAKLETYSRSSYVANQIRRLNDRFEDVRNYGAVGNGIADDTAALQAAIDASRDNRTFSVYLPPGEFRITSTVNLHDKCRVYGAGFDSWHNDDAQIDHPTQITWDGAVGGTMIRCSPVSGPTAEYFSCGALIDVALFGNTVAAIGLELISHRFGEWKFYGQGFTTCILYLGCVEEVVPGSSADTQNNLFYIVGKQRRLNDGDGIYCDGSPSNDANTSQNLFEMVEIKVLNGAAMVFANSDANIVRFLRCLKTGSGYGVKFLGGASAGYRSRANIIDFCSASVAAYGTEAYAVASGPNWVRYFDSENSVFEPAFVGTDATIYWGTVSKRDYGLAAYKLAISNTNSTVSTNRTSLLASTASCRIYSDVSDNLRLASSTEEWALDVTNSTGMRIRRVSGSGSLALPDNVQVGTTVTLRAGTGSPEGVVTANVGSLFLRTDGGAGTTLYVKQTGTGNTGWAAK